MALQISAYYCETSRSLSGVAKGPSLLGSYKTLPRIQ